MNREIKFRAWDKANKAMLDDVWYVRGFHLLKYNDGDFEIMQYVGLKDKNGTEIYEGDIIESPFFDGENLVVEYNSLYCQFTFGAAEFNVEKKNNEIEIIGNIYENPELPLLPF